MVIDEKEQRVEKLYELSDDVKRKEWLDDWLNFMHRIGKPVTRIPIMAKQVLDLYELYHLVVRHGGLVEIINKKLWREITKGLNLPNSITSAAFTLRTQYQKYLYDYECEHENLSRLSDLTAAIEGNRRESRRTNPSDTPTNTSMQSGHNGYDRNSIGVGFSRNQHSQNSANDYEDLSGTTNSAMSAAAASGLFPYSLLGSGVPPMMATLLGKHIDNMKDSFATAESNCNPNLNVPFGSHRQLEIFQRAAFDAMNASGQQHGAHTGTMGNGTGVLNVNQHSASGRNSTSSFADSDSGCCAAKKPRPDRFSSSVAHSLGLASNGNKTEKMSKAASKSSNSSPHMKLTSSTNNDGSMVVSMEFNGVAYQGVLFATNNVLSSSSAPATRAPTSTTSVDRNCHYNNNNNVGEQTAGNVTLNSASEAAISAAATAAASKFFSSMLQNVARNAATTEQGGDTAFGNATGTLQSSNADEAADSGSMAVDNCDENNDENSHVINFVAKENNTMSTAVGDSESMEVVLKNNGDFGGGVESTTVESECGSVMEDLKKSLALSSVFTTTTSS